jgi:transcriptional activator SPT8
MDVDGDAPATMPSETTRYSPSTQSKPSKSELFSYAGALYITHGAVKAPPVLQTRERSLSPAQFRKNKLILSSGSSFSTPGSYTVEAVCAIAHPAPTHALASSLCMSHLLTGSDDGYIRDYDVFAAVNGKSFLTAPQRHHCGVVEGIMKAGQIRSWWENPDMSRFNGATQVSDDPSISPVYSLLMQSDALWALAGSNVCSPTR